MLVFEKNAMTTEIEGLVGRYGTGREALLPILQEIQAKHRYISAFAQQEVARVLDIHPVEVYSVITFYSFLGAKERGRNIIRVCQTISCDLAGKEGIIQALEQELGITVGDTTKDQRYTLETTNCMGMCDQGPAMMVNDDVYTHLTPEKAVDIIANYK